MAAPTTSYANGVFIGQKRSSGADQDLAQEADFKAGQTDDPDTANSAEALGARHRRRFGYTAEGAQENDVDIMHKGRKPLRIDGPHRQQNVGESRIGHFKHAIVMTRKPTTVVQH